MRVKCIFIAAVLAILTFASENSFAQQCGSWTQLLPSNSPQARLRHSFVYNSSINKGVLFGGTSFANSSIAVLGDTWLFNSATQNWEGPLALSTAPAARYGASLAYDSIRRVVVLFGGANSSNAPLNDTWEFNGNTWVNITPVNSPAARVFHSLVFSEALGQVILFGGLSNGSLVQDTWGWDGTQWSKITDFKPSARELQSISYDEARDRVVLFGGYDGANYTGDTWELVGTDWQQASSSLSPSARIESAFTFFPLLRRNILNGGLTLSGTTGETWSWDGLNWQQLLVAGPSARRGAVSTYDSKLQGALLFGGTNDTGSLFSDTWIFSAPDGDKDGLADCIDSCPLDPLKTSPGLCGCGATEATGCIASFSAIVPTKPGLSIVSKAVRVKMLARTDSRYLLSYYDTKKLKGKAKPKVVTVNSKRATVDVKNLLSGHTYSFSYLYQQKVNPKAKSQVSAKKNIKVKFKSR